MSCVVIFPYNSVRVSDCTNERTHKLGKDHQTKQLAPPQFSSCDVSETLASFVSLRL